MATDLKETLIGYDTDKATEEFCWINQYHSFNTKAKNDLRNIYAELFDNFQPMRDPIEQYFGKYSINQLKFNDLHNIV